MRGYGSFLILFGNYSKNWWNLQYYNIFFLKKKRSTIYVPIYSMYSKLRLKFTLASRFMRKKYKRMLKVHFEIKLK